MKAPAVVMEIGAAGLRAVAAGVTETGAMASISASAADTRSVTLPLGSRRVMARRARCRRRSHRDRRHGLDLGVCGRHRFGDAAVGLAADDAEAVALLLVQELRR